MTTQLYIKAWGTRGSIPTPGPTTLKYGGNTSCLEVRCNQSLIIFDAGTGLRNLGLKLAQEMPIEAHLFLSHLHWDHIQGFPFFDPIFHAGNRIIVYGEKKDEPSIEAAFAKQMVAPYFPLSFQDIPVTLQFQDVAPNQTVSLAPDLTVQTFRAFHPNDSLAYRLTYGSHTLAYITDAEMQGDIIDPELIMAARGVDYLICDGMFTTDQYQGHNGEPCRVGWGHMTWQQAVELAQLAGVKHLILWHHYQHHDDQDLAALEKEAQQIFAPTMMAYEGMEIRV